MKKLMIAAATAALAGMTFAANVYDYKASVKYVDFKKVTVNKVKVDVKTVKSATLKGYLVTPIGCGCTLGESVTGLDPAFLIVQNNKKYGPKVLPANLLAKYWQTSSSTKTLEADGYLFAGVMDKASNNFVAIPSAAYDFGDKNSAESVHLFGAYNEAEPGSGKFVEAWLTHAGFGKAAPVTEVGSGCKPDDTDYCLKSLSGSVVGGSFTCQTNKGTLLEKFLCQGWNETDELYLMDVISGTWSIKANAKIEAATLTAAEAALISNMTSPNAATELGYLKACGQKLSKGYVLTGIEANFASTWF